MGEQIKKTVLSSLTIPIIIFVVLVGGSLILGILQQGDQKEATADDKSGFSTSSEEVEDDSDDGEEKDVDDGDGYTKVVKFNGKEYKLYKQNATTSSYGDILYSEGTISSGGCGLVSATIVASGYVDYEGTPGDLLDEMKSSGKITEYATQGSKGPLAGPTNTKLALEIAGVSCSNNDSPSEEEIEEQLKKNKPIVICVGGTNADSFSDSAHYIALLATKDGQAYVANPLLNKENGWYDISEIVQSNASHGTAIFVD